MNTGINWEKQFKLDENQALKNIYDQYRKPFIAWIQSTSNCDYNEAIDLFQVSVVILYENLLKGKVKDIKNIKSYLFAIGKNKLLEHYRAAKKNKHSNLSEGTIFEYVYEDESHDEDQLEKINLLNKSMKELGDPCFSILKAFYFEKLSMIEIAEKLNYKNSDTVKTKKFKCINRLRKAFL